MIVGMTGSSGFIGTALRACLEKAGHAVTRIYRKGAAGPEGIEWDLAEPGKLGARLEGLDAVVHLAGAGISDHRWTNSYKEEILRSRVQGTKSLATALAGMKNKPEIFVSASAVGYYGPHGAEPLDESAEHGNDFLAGVCVAWEEAAQEAAQAGIRVAHPRTGLVLGKQGGALKKMLLPFKLGLGGIIGSGEQIYSWISLADWCEALRFILESHKAQGPYNFTAPKSCSNHEFTQALGKALHRPTIFPMPAAAAKLAFGEMAEALLLSGQNVKPTKLEAQGFRFQSASIDEALASVLA